MPRSSENEPTIEKTGRYVRNIGIGAIVIGAMFAPGLIGPGIMLAVSGEGFRQNRANVAKEI